MRNDTIRLHRSPEWTGPFIRTIKAADEIYRTIYFKCGPHSIVKLVEQRKRARRK